MIGRALIAVVLVTLISCTWAKKEEPIKYEPIEQDIIDPWTGKKVTDPEPSPSTRPVEQFVKIF